MGTESNKGLGRKFAEMKQVKNIEYDFEDRVACNCSLLEVFPVYEGGQQKDTIFMGTYDGHLYSMRITIKEESIVNA